MVDGAGDLREEWFEDVDTVIVTAGASAPEIVVQECISYLTKRFGASLSEEMLREESVQFSLPRELQQLTTTSQAISGEVPTGSQRKADA